MSYGLRNRILSFQFLRAVAFICVFLGHFGVFSYAGVFSDWAVSSFYILSGFLNVYHYTSDENEPILHARYAVNKIRKLYPLYIITTILAALLQIYHDSSNSSLDFFYIKATIIRIMMNVLLVSNWFPRSDFFYPYNIVTWFISNLFLYYFFTPWIISIYKRRISKALHRGCNVVVDVFLCLTYMVFLCIVFYHFLFAKENYWWFTYENPFLRIGDYVSGVIIGWYCIFKEKTNLSNRYNLFHFIISIIFSIILVVFRMHFISESFVVFSRGFYFLIPSCYLIYALSNMNVSLDKNNHLHFLLNLLFYIGNQSAYLYLIHVPIIGMVHGILVRIGIDNLGIWIISSASLSFTCC